jgi:GntR family transcriptional regulator/MocR family aminotransferase
MDARTAPRMSPPALIDLELDRLSPLPLHVQIFRYFQSSIAAGALRKDTRLPTTRDLARRLGTTRNTVVVAYDLLLGEGLLEGRGRQGTFVLEDSAFTQERKPQNAPLRLLREGAGESGGEGQCQPRLDWWPGQARAHALPTAAWRNACRKAGYALPPADFGDAQGDAGLRKAICVWLAEHRSITVDASCIVVTRGSADFLRLLSKHMIRAGDRCAIEDPGHPLVRQAFLKAGADIDYVPVDEEGLQIDRAFRADSRPALVHLTPNHQYPMGGRLSAARRHLLVRQAQDHGTLILESEYGCEFTYEGSDYPTLYSMAPANTILIGTFANAASPALRTGFAVVPAQMVALFKAWVGQAHQQASWPAQKIMEELLRSGELDRHVRRSRRHYLAIRRLIQKQLAPWGRYLSVHGEGAGLHVVLRGQTAAIDSALQDALTAHGVRFQSLADLTARAPCRRGFLFGYGHMESAMVHKSLAQLVACLHQVISSIEPGSDR